MYTGYRRSRFRFRVPSSRRIRRRSCTVNCITVDAHVKGRGAEASFNLDATPYSNTVFSAPLLKRRQTDAKFARLRVLSRLTGRVARTRRFTERVVIPLTELRGARPRKFLLAPKLVFVPET